MTVENSYCVSTDNQEQGDYRSSSTPVLHCTDQEASLLCEKLQNEETFEDAASILMSWLVKDHCSKENARSFFSMIQSANSHVKKLVIVKLLFENQLDEAKNEWRKVVESIILQFEDIENKHLDEVLQCCDQLTEAQRENIQLLKKQVKELKKGLKEELICKLNNEEMELSDEESSNTVFDIEQLKEQVKNDILLNQDESKSLRWMLDDVQHDIVAVRCSIKEQIKFQNKQITNLQQALRNTEMEEFDTSEKCFENEYALKGKEVKKANSYLYNIIDCICRQVKEMQHNKEKYGDLLNKAQMLFKQHLECVIQRFLEMKKIFKAASVQKCWNHFTDAQRGNIQMWKKHTEELKCVFLVELNYVKHNTVMESSDYESETDVDIEQLEQYKDDIHSLQEETKLLKYQIKCIKSEIKNMQSDYDYQFRQMGIVQQALKESINELNLSQSYSINGDGLMELGAFEPMFTEGISASDNSVHLGMLLNVNEENEARLLGLISILLHESYPSGVSIDYICSYLQEHDSSILSSDIEYLLRKYSSIFREDHIVIGDTIENRWYFSGFHM